MDVNLIDGILRREISSSGRSRCFINGALANLTMLRRLGEELIRIHGQQKHQLLVKPSHQLDLLDAFGGLMPQRKEFSSLLSRYKACAKKLSELEKSLEQRNKERELAAFQRDEIDRACVSLEEEKKLIRIKKKVSTQYEIANILYSVDEKPTIFENVEGYDFPVFAGITSSRDIIAKALGTTKEQLLFKLVHALRNPAAPKMVNKAPCQEVIIHDPDLNKLPLLHHLPGDGGRYATATVCTIKDPDTGRNVSYHRLMQISKNRFTARLIKNRQTRTTYDKIENDLEMAVCIGNSVAVMVAASLGPPSGVDEFAIANTLDETPLVKWSAWIDTTSMKSNYRLSLLMETDDDRSTIFAKTPFDIVKRPRVDTDLFSNELPQRFKAVLLAAREKDTVRDFPFQGFVCLSDEKKSTGVFAKALREYSIDKKGVIRITLVRAVDWIAKEKVSTRTGDAGPRIFVPGARCKGKMRFDLAFISINSDVRSEEFFRWYQLFENEPVRVDVKNSQGILRELSVYSGNLPYTGAVSVHNRIFLRVYNPYNKRVSNLEPGQIGLCEVQSVFPSKTVENIESRIYDIPQFPVKKRNDSFSKNDLVRIEKQLSRLERKTKLLRERASSMKRNSLSFHRAMHKILSLQRTQLELKLSLTLCKGRAIDRIAWELNELRSKRRTYDYILELAESGRS